MTPEEWVAERRKLKREATGREWSVSSTFGDVVAVSGGDPVAEAYDRETTALIVAACNDTDKVCDLVEAVAAISTASGMDAEGATFWRNMSDVRAALDALTGGES